MNKLTKIGASALAGSLVASSAYAGSVSVGATWELTGEYVNNAKATSGVANETGNPFGSKGNLSFSGSGETDFGTASWFMFTTDAQSGVSSHSITLDMGDMGTVGFDQGTGAFGIGTIDDAMPTAYEEIWNGTAQTNGDILDGSGGATGVFGYKNTFAGMDVNLEYAPSVGSSTDNGDGGASATASVADGTSLNAAVTNSSMVEGLTFGLGVGETSYDRASGDVANIDTASTVLFAKYAFGPVTVGYQTSEVDGQTTSQDDESTAMSISYAVNDDLSVSYGTHEMDFGDSTTDQESKGIGISYSMGGMSIAIQKNEIDNVAGSTAAANDIEGYDLNVAFSF